MKRAVVFAFVLMLLSAAFVAVLIGLVVATGAIYVRSDGSVDSATAPIQRVGNVYTFTSNTYNSLVVERDSIVVDGAGYTLWGTGSGLGVNVLSSNMTIKNTQITHFFRDILLWISSNNTISGNTITNNDDGIWVETSNNIITGNYIAANTGSGIWMQESKSNTIIKNYIANNGVGIWFTTYMVTELNNRIYHNSFINNTKHVDQRTQPFPTIWVAAAVAIVTIGAACLYYFAKIKKTQGKAEQ
jgi:parallel beta-helix repeat protein